MIDLGKFKDVTAVLKLKTQFSPKELGCTKYLLEVKKNTFFNALKDGVDQTFEPLFTNSVSIEL